MSLMKSAAVSPPAIRTSRPREGGGLAGAVGDQPDSLHTVLELIRAGVGRTRPELVRHSGLGRKVVTQRVEQLIRCGLVADGELGPSTGGRAPRELRFRADGGILLVAELGGTSISVGITDLAGHLLDQHEEPADINDGPEKLLGLVEDLFDQMLADHAPAGPSVWGIGIGVLGPVNAATGRPVALPHMPGWADYPVRDRLAARYDVPVWVENEINLMALGEFRAGLGRGERDIAFIKIGSGIGAGLISAGRLHRGAHGAAGEIGHIAVVDDESVLCWCGNTGCLAELAGGRALARLGGVAADSGHSPYLAALRSGGHQIDARDVAAAAAAGDPAGVELLTRAGQYIGQAAATLVNNFNPALILIGGGVAAAGDMLLAAIRRTVYRRSLPLSTRDLRIAFSPLSDTAGLVGAAFMVIDELLSREHLGRWIDNGSPAGRAALIHQGLDAATR
jgi:glucokinase-like ROK family protein